MSSNTARAFEAWAILTEAERAELELLIRGFLRGAGLEKRRGRPPGSKSRVKANGVEETPEATTLG